MIGQKALNIFRRGSMKLIIGNDPVDIMKGMMDTCNSYIYPSGGQEDVAIVGPAEHISQVEEHGLDELKELILKRSDAGQWGNVQLVTVSRHFKDRLHATDKVLIRKVVDLALGGDYGCIIVHRLESCSTDGDLYRVLKSIGDYSGVDIFVTRQAVYYERFQITGYEGEEMDT
jgi:hypothetical protein